MREETVLFGKTSSLVGIITDPSPTDRESGNHLPAIILLNSGPVHRVGPHRLYVTMARHLASTGFTVLRFDFSGIGDSRVRYNNLPFEKAAVSETQEAMDFLSSARGIEQFVLIGICSGADISFQIACCDRRAVGAVPINLPRYQPSDELSSYLIYRGAARYYWKAALFNPKSWLRLIKGKAIYQNIIGAIGLPIISLFVRKTNVSSKVNNFATDLRLLTERDVRLLLVYSEWDPGLDYLHVILGDKIHELSLDGKLKVEIIPQADHIFTPLWSQEHLLKVVQNWALASW